MDFSERRKTDDFEGWHIVTVLPMDDAGWVLTHCNADLSRGMMEIVDLHLDLDPDRRFPTADAAIQFARSEVKRWKQNRQRDPEIERIKRNFRVVVKA